MVKLHMGCDGQVWGVQDGIAGPDGSAEDWINIDLYFPEERFLTSPKAQELISGFPRVIRLDFQQLPFPDDFADYIYSNHSLEHISTARVLPTLEEWRRVLKPKGVLHIIVPDLLGIAKKIVSSGGFLNWSKRGEEIGPWSKGYTKLINGIYGDDSRVFQHHKTGFTPLHMHSLLVDAGFVDIDIKDVWAMEIFSLEVKAIK